MFDSFNRSFLWGFLHFAASLHDMTTLKAEFKWTENAEAAFHLLTEAMSNLPVLAFSDENKQFFVHTNVSKCTLVALFWQVVNKKKMRAVQYASRKLSKTVHSYSYFKREAAARVFAL